MNSVKNHLLKAWSGFVHLTGRYFRRLSKEVVIFLPALLIILLLFNVLQPQTLFDRTKNKASQSPRDLKSKLILARLLYQNNNLNSAEIELQKILTSSKRDNETKVAAILLLDQIKNAKNVPSEIRNTIKSWEELNSLYPNSRDINLQLAFLNWKLYRNFEALKYFAKAQALDPNNEEISKLKNALSD